MRERDWQLNRKKGHAVSPLFECILFMYMYRATERERELRRSWTLKDECQFHVKSFVLFLFSRVWDSSDPKERLIFTLAPHPVMTSNSIHTYNMFIHLYPIHELNLKVNENLSYLNAKSQDRENEEYYYTIERCVHQRRWTNNLAKAHVARFTYSKRKKCQFVMLVNNKVMRLKHFNFVYLCSFCSLSLWCLSIRSLDI